MKLTTWLATIAYGLMMATAAVTPALAVSNGVNAQAGTATEQFLKIPTSARYYAMGGAYAAVANDAAGMYGQPAASLGVEHVELAGTHNEWLSDVKHEYLSFVYKVDADRALSGQITYLGVDGFARTDEDAAGNYVAANSGGTFDASDFALAAGYAQQLTPTVRAGGTIKLVRSTIDGIDANAGAVDAGIMWQATDNLTLGASLTNLGSRMKFISTSNRLPMTWRAGAAYRLPLGEFADFTLTGDAMKAVDARCAGRFGMELSGDFWALRGGWRTDNALDNGWSAGAGVKLFDVLRIDYAYAPGGILGNTQFFTATYSFQ
ncbi:MAG TPA: PorV/PorQ family protein [bacterium]|nr:PorV/PorQ family protein [bacterium]